MGYYINYTLESKHNREELNIPDGIECKYGVDELFDFGCVNEVKWYSHIKDMLLLSKVNPDVEFLTSCVDEEQSDIWQAKFLNGRYKKIKAQIVMEKYNDVEWKVGDVGVMCGNSDCIAFRDEQLELVSESEKKPIKSDGGSSSYYFTKLPQKMIDSIVEKGGIEIKDIVRHCFYNDADCKDIIKALKRIQETKRGGGKDGASIEYDTNKILFFANELKENI